MSEMIERVARVIMETDIAMTLADYPDMPPDIGRELAEAMYWTHYLPVARAAIEAMRKPTDAMTASCGAGECAKWAPGAWANYIDAALSEGKP